MRLFFHEFGVSVAVVHPSFLAGDFNDLDAYLDRVDEVVRQDPEFLKPRLFTFGGLDLSRPPDRLVELAEGRGLAGFKLHPLQGFPVSRDALEPYLRTVARLGLPVYVHTDWVPSTEFKAKRTTLEGTLGKLVDLAPDVMFVAGHAGNSDSYLSFHRVLKGRPNLLVETSMAPVPSELEVVVKRWGSDRLLWGSNAPYCSVLGELERVRVTRLSVPEKERAFAGNAAELLGISEERLYRLRAELAESGGSGRGGGVR